MKKKLFGTNFSVRADSKALSFLESDPILSRFYLLKAESVSSSALNLNRNDLLTKLAEYGAVLLRGFPTTTDQFSKLVDLVTPKTAIDPAREFFAKNVQLVDSGVNEIGLHCENGTTPLVPHIVWFYCERAASQGSQTTICDGVAVWNLLSPEAKELFLSRRIIFSRNVKNDLWVKYVKHHYPHLHGESHISQKMLDDVFSSISGANVSLNSDGSLFLSHAVFAAKKTFFSSSIAFANSLFGPSHNYEAPQISFENGEMLPDWLLAESRGKAASLTIDIPWETGDIVLIDNSRVMHGRRRITDTNRKLFTALGFLPEEFSTFGQISADEEITQ